MPTETTGVKTRYVLIVDDEEDIREVAQLSLESFTSWEVSTVGSGSEGFAIAEASRPDAILLDVMMPDMDGLATLQKLRSHPTTKLIPVILITAKAQAIDKNRVAKLGVAAIISKPFDPMTLAFEIASILGWV